MNRPVYHAARRPLLSALLASWAILAMAPPAQATEQAQQRRAARDVRQDVRQQSREAKQDCRQEQLLGNTDCRREHRNNKQAARNRARDIKY